MTRFGPSRGEHKLRVAIGVLGMALTLGAILFHGTDSLKWIEVAVIGGAFFSGTAALSARALMRKESE